MINTFLFRIFSLCLVVLLIFCPTSTIAGEIDSSLEKSIPLKTDDNPVKMTQKQMNDLFGEDPYLGQTSYLQSPDGFSQREQTK